MLNKKLNCEVNELYKSLTNKEGGIVIDVREYPEYAAGRIPQSVLISVADLEKRVNQLDRSLPIYVICRSGRRSSEAQERLLALGFLDVRNVVGGMLAWQKAGFPIEREQKAPWTLERQVRFVAGLLVLIGVLLSVFIAQSFIWLSAFVGAGLIFAAVTDSCAMAMFLTHMPWNKAHQTTCSFEDKTQRG
ncbi:MAG: rhodanese-like domain-containing protein [Acidobacteria bacterium]|nr:rhodanese-like domain-containing protein [Acidobacteriota bacterium]